MKKSMILILCVMIFATLAMAQNASYTSGTGITSAVDVLGAQTTTVAVARAAMLRIAAHAVQAATLAPAAR